VQEENHVEGEIALGCLVRSDPLCLPLTAGQGCLGQLNSGHFD
jgi:hypothetical protein